MTTLPPSECRMSDKAVSTEDLARSYADMQRTTMSSVVANELLRLEAALQAVMQATSPEDEVPVVQRRPRSHSHHHVAAVHPRRSRRSASAIVLQQHPYCSHHLHPYGESPGPSTISSDGNYYSRGRINSDHLCLPVTELELQGPLVAAAGKRRRKKRKKRKSIKTLGANVSVVDPDELPKRARWTIVATACLLLFMCFLLVGITLRMAPIIDEMEVRACRCRYAASDNAPEIVHGDHVLRDVTATAAAEETRSMHAAVWSELMEPADQVVVADEFSSAELVRTSSSRRGKQQQQQPRGKRRSFRARKSRSNSVKDAEALTPKEIRRRRAVLMVLSTFAFLLVISVLFVVITLTQTVFHSKQHSDAHLQAVRKENEQLMNSLNRAGVTDQTAITSSSSNLSDSAAASSSTAISENSTAAATLLPP